MFAVLVQHYCLNNNAGLTKEILQKFDKKSQNTVFISVEKFKKKKKVESMQTPISQICVK